MWPSSRISPHPLVADAAGQPWAARWRWSTLPIRFKLWVIMLPVQMLGLAIPVFWLLSEHKAAKDDSYLRACRDKARVMTNAELAEAMSAPPEDADSARLLNPVTVHTAAIEDFGLQAPVPIQFRIDYLRKGEENPQRPRGRTPDDVTGLAELNSVALTPLKYDAQEMEKWNVRIRDRDRNELSVEELHRVQTYIAALEREQKGDDGPLERARPDDQQLDVSQQWIRVLTIIAAPVPDHYVASILEVPRQPMRDDLRRMNLWTLVLVLSSATVLLPLIHLAVSRPVVGPVQHLASLMRQAAPETLGTMRISVTRHDEIGELQRAFNVMATEITQKQQELRESKESLEIKVADRTAELARSNKDLDEFAYTVAHDLQAPLRNVSFLLSQEIPQAIGKGDHAEVGQLLKRCQDRCEFNIQMVKELLAWARITHETRQNKPVDLRKVVDDVRVNLRAQLDERHATLQIAGNLPTITGDPMLMNRVVTNLVTNGIKYNDKSEKVIEIGVKDLENTGPTLYVRDNGIGIKPQHFDRLFQLLVQLHKVELYGRGIGMGLAIVKRAVESYGGTVWAESQYGQGTTFWLTLPASPNAAGTKS